MTTTSNTRAGERCPTCRRKPSERTDYAEITDGGTGEFKYVKHKTCVDPIHNLADAAPALYEALRGLVEYQICRCEDDDLNHGICGFCLAMRPARAALSLATEGK